MRKKYDTPQRKRAFKLMAAIAALIVAACLTRSFSPLPSGAVGQAEQQTASGRTRIIAQYRDRDINEVILLSENENTLLCTASAISVSGWSCLGCSPAPVSDGRVTVGSFGGSNSGYSYMYFFGSAADSRAAGVTAELTETDMKALPMEIVVRKTEDGKLFFLAKYYKKADEETASFKYCTAKFSDASGKTLYYENTLVYY